MSGDTSAFGFGKFIPGFEFLQGLAQGAGAAANPLGRVPQWVAPTVSVEEVDKRIAELKAVQFWLEQNGRALAATIQALEVQRMTLSTLQGMNVSMSDLAKNFPFPGGQATAASAFAGWPMGADGSRPEESVSAPAAPPEPQAEASKPAADASEAAGSAQQQTQAALGQAMQWWGALTQQFQQIAAKAMAEPVQAETVAAAQRATEAASSFAKSAMDKVMEQASAFTSGADAKAAGKQKPAAEASAATTKATGASRKPAAKKAAAQKPVAKTAAAPAARKRAAAPRKS
ncbi:MAG: hypothetical protein LBJ15_05140 [Comamonas sp.]|jgi:hypothetical protein|uniref:PhaM family polyhydroxyalkanoate granule multifunctional regulatory protein n=1 Tax=Comamonas sp. TaxID=34028 RepID=UPI00281871A0|nr:PhaM family polyhydroxyalkanoate granule multifunctional regulatory protein [Comamonas sp.]MDR0213376.1 hypothetical protein [Comamonas sp.]